MTDQLKFCWATDPISFCETHPILHMAGITEELKKEHFYKGDFIEKNPISEINNNPNKFDFILEESATLRYVHEIKNRSTDYLLQ